MLHPPDECEAPSNWLLFTHVPDSPSFSSTSAAVVISRHRLLQLLRQKQDTTHVSGRAFLTLPDRFHKPEATIQDFHPQLNVKTSEL